MNHRVHVYSHVLKANGNNSRIDFVSYEMETEMFYLDFRFDT